MLRPPSTAGSSNAPSSRAVVAPPAPSIPSVGSDSGGTSPPGLDTLDDDLWTDAEPAGDQLQAGAAATPWEGYEAPRLVPPTGLKESIWMCPLHGSLCNPGICKERAWVEREMRRRDALKEERRVREENKRHRKALRTSNQKKSEKQAGAMGEGERERSPHLHRRDASSGSNSSNNRSGSNSDTPRDQGAVFLLPNDSHIRRPDRVCSPRNRLQYPSAS